jgi:hypothetical protein
VSLELYDIGAVLGLILIEGLIKLERDTNSAALALITYISSIGILLSKLVEYRSHLDYLLKQDYNSVLILY